jgi:hypothetical protein
MLKTLIIFGLTGATLVGSESAQAQDLTAISNTKTHSGAGFAMHRPSLYLNDMNRTSARHFMYKYGIDRGEVWDTNVAGYRASFRSENILYLVDYDKNGNWSGTTRIYNETKLPRDIRRIVRSTYYDYAIKSVSEVSSAQKLIYFVKIQDAVALKTVRVMDGDMQVIEEFNRGDRDGH